MANSIYFNVTALRFRKQNNIVCTARTGLYLTATKPCVCYAAFAEGRRGELTATYHQYTGSGMGSCPDGPDTRLAYKRSADYGASWSPIKILMQPANEAAENGRSQSQASPLIDPSTKTLFVGFNNGQGMAGPSVPGLINSTGDSPAELPPPPARALRFPLDRLLTLGLLLVNHPIADDGISWSPIYVPTLNLGGGTTQPADTRTGFGVGPTKGLTVTSPSGGVRLLLPGEGGRFGATSIYSDDHGTSLIMRNPFTRVLPRRESAFVSVLKSVGLYSSVLVCVHRPFSVGSLVSF